MNYDDLFGGDSRSEINSALAVESTAHNVTHPIDALLEANQELIVIDPNFSLATPEIAHLILQRLQVISTGIQKLIFITSTETDELEFSYYQNFMERYQFLPMIELLVLPKADVGELHECCYFLAKNMAMKVRQSQLLSLKTLPVLPLESCSAQDYRMFDERVAQLIKDNYSQMVAFESLYIN